MIFGEYSDIVKNDILTMQRFLDVGLQIFVLWGLAGMYSIFTARRYQNINWLTFYKYLRLRYTAAEMKKEELLERTEQEPRQVHQIHHGQEGFLEEELDGEFWIKVIKVYFVKEKTFSLKILIVDRWEFSISI